MTNPPSGSRTMSEEVKAEVEILRRALAWHGDPQRMATTREEWQQTIDDAIVWVKANPEPDRPSFSSYSTTRPSQPAVAREGCVSRDQFLAFAAEMLAQVAAVGGDMVTALRISAQAGVDAAREPLSSAADGVATPPADVAVREAAQFLSDRLDSLEWMDDDLAATCRDYFGHVEPAHARLKAALAAGDAS